MLRETWRPAKPELTDTVCRVLAARSPAGRLRGFVSYFGCHPVTCCAATRYIHGDYCGVATNLLERENPGSTGLFIQGAQGDVNTCVVHKPEQESLLALDIIAGRYANAVRRGINAATPVPIDCLKTVRQRVAFTRKPWGAAGLRQRLIVCGVPQPPRAHDDFAGATAVSVWRRSTRSLLRKMRPEPNAAEPTDQTGSRGCGWAPTILSSGSRPCRLSERDRRRRARTYLGQRTDERLGGLC